VSEAQAGDLGRLLLLDIEPILVLVGRGNMTVVLGVASVLAERRHAHLLHPLFGELRNGSIMGKHIFGLSSFAGNPNFSFVVDHISHRGSFIPHSGNGAKLHRRRSISKSNAPSFGGHGQVFDCFRRNQQALVVVVQLIREHGPFFELRPPVLHVLGELLGDGLSGSVFERNTLVHVRSVGHRLLSHTSELGGFGLQLLDHWLVVHLRVAPDFGFVSMFLLEGSVVILLGQHVEAAMAGLQRPVLIILSPGARWWRQSGSSDLGLQRRLIRSFD